MTTAQDQHRPGCPALGGYGHGAEECICGATTQQHRALIAAWNAQADEHNQWETLGDDEKIYWAMQAARALPAGMEPVARVCQGATANIEWRKGMTYADLPAIDGQDLYTAAQVLAMLAQGLAPGWQAVPVEPTGDMLVAIMSSGEVDVLRETPEKHQVLLIDRAGIPDRYTALLAAAPRPPVAQDELEIEQTRREAESLAWSLFNRHYAKGEDYTSGRSVFGLCDSLRGVLSQIDNMTAGLVRDPAAQVDCIGLALELESQAQRVESQSVERAMAAAAQALRLLAITEPQAPTTGAGSATPEVTQERKPLTDEQVQDLIGFGDPTAQEWYLVRLGWDAAQSIEAPR